MKTNKPSKIIIVITVIVLAILLIPYDRSYLSDGGTTNYYAVLYTATHMHQIKSMDHTNAANYETTITYTEGWVIHVLGYEVYKNVSEVDEVVSHN